MNREQLLELLSQVRRGDVELDDAVEELRRLPFERLGDVATLDHQRELRSGVPEVVYGESKAAAEIATILEKLASTGHGALATRVAPEKAERVREVVPKARYHADSRIMVLPGESERPRVGTAPLAIAFAGTSDVPVAEEAALTAEFLGFEVARFADIGIAGLQRVVDVAEDLRRSEVVIAVAGMEGALPSVIAALIDRPVIAVPTSVGYGVGLGGYVAMLSMLATCSPGVTVVNIDNGFGAAVAARRIVRRL